LAEKDSLQENESVSPKTETEETISVPDRTVVYHKIFEIKGPCQLTINVTKRAIEQHEGSDIDPSEKRAYTWDELFEDPFEVFEREHPGLSELELVNLYIREQLGIDDEDQD
jgi:hypothetical protein